jgi:hypothetical protein
VARLANVDPSWRSGLRRPGFAPRVEEAARMAAEAGETWTDLDLDAQDAWYRQRESGATPGVARGRWRPPTRRVTAAPTG